MTNLYDYVAVLQCAIDAFAGQDVETVIEMFAVDCVLAAAADPRDQHVGRDAVRSSMADLLKTTAGARLELVDFVVDPDRLRVEFSIRGTVGSQFGVTERRYRLSDLAQ
jgi:hypothetical protein